MIRAKYFSWEYTPDREYLCLELVGPEGEVSIGYLPVGEVGTLINDLCGSYKHHPDSAEYALKEQPYG